MTCYNWEGLSKPYAMIGASFVGGVERRLVISSHIVQLLWDYGIGYSHMLGWCGFSQVVFMIWWLFLSSALETLLEARLFGRSFVSLHCGLCGEKGMLGISRILRRHWRWCGTCFISMFLFRLIILRFLNPILWV